MECERMKTRKYGLKYSLNSEEPLNAGGTIIIFCSSFLFIIEKL